MSVYKQARGKTYRYRFWLDGECYRGNTHQRTKTDAEAVEALEKTKVRQRLGGLLPADAIETPTFSAWADVTLAYQTKYITRPAILERTLRMILAFWGAPPATPIGPSAVPRRERAPRPYHGLRLGDPIADPSWLQRFELWMEARGLSGSTRNSYLSACSDLYTCAMQPQFKADTGIAVNPFAGIRRSPTRTRTVTMSPSQILALVEIAGRHIAQALCIAALAPKLRVSSILALEWAVHLDADLTLITVSDHKTRAAAGTAQTIPVSAQLRTILQEIRAGQAPDARAVILWRGEPIKSIKKGLKRAVEALGLKWGLADGVTFHVMRHSVATILANPSLVGVLTERLRADVMGHLEIRTTQKYTHLNTSVQEGPHEALSAALPGLRAAAARKSCRAKSTPVAAAHREKRQQNRVVTFTRPYTPDPQKREIS
jgi:integrase